MIDVARAPLFYCTNIHPGESWLDVQRNLEDHLLAVKGQVSPAVPFPVGLRLSAQAAAELDDDGARRFAAWCAIHQCFVPSLNGFPHGRFHGGGVKEKVYLPDWRDPERVAYTRRLADLLAGWLPQGMVGSISTVPVAFRRGFDEADWPLVRSHLVTVLEHLESIRQEQGVEIVLALEPEPACVLETCADVVAFFERMDLPAPLRELAGVCFDACHQAVEFEDPADSLASLRRAGVRIAKVQVSSAPRAVGDEIEALERFDEPTYLHQVVARTPEGELLRYDDLPAFLARGDRPVEECRVHFHVPIFAERLGECGTTRFFLEDLLPRLAPSVPLEVETYSWGVLPESLRSDTLSGSIVRELLWARERIDAANRRT